jgi:dihydrofolate synthase/folylpolyglutamate synthase
VVGYRSPSSALIERAEALGCALFVLGRDFKAEGDDGRWSWIGPGKRWDELPDLPMRGAFQRDNAAAAVMAVSCLDERLPVPVEAVRRGLKGAIAKGRFEIVPGEPTWILDVAHNGQAARSLAANLRSFECHGRIHGVLGVLKDKDPRAIAEPLAGLVDFWYLGQAKGLRAMPVTDLQKAVEGVITDSNTRACGGIDEALSAAAAYGAPGDCIIAFGSFTTVESALLHLAGHIPASGGVQPPLLG